MKPRIDRGRPNLCHSSAALARWQRVGCLTSRDTPPHQECGGDRDGKDDEEGRGFLGDGVPRLGNPDPHVDAGADEPDGDEDLRRLSQADGRRGVSCPSTDEETEGEEEETSGDDPDRMHLLPFGSGTELEAA